VHITNVYNKTVINNVTVNRVSFNGGSGGVSAQATVEESAAARDRHVAATSLQQQHVQAARSNPVLRASANQGKPPIAATARPANFSGPGVVAAKPSGNANVARVNTEPHTSTPRPAMEPRPATQPSPAPREHVSQPRPPAPVEPQQKPEHTQAPRPMPKPQAQAPQHPAEHPAEHPEDHEHHQS